MTPNKSPVQEHVIRAMRKDDGFIRAEIVENRVEHVVNIRTADGYKQYCTIAKSDFLRLVDEGVVKHVGEGKWKLTEQD